MAEVGIRLPSLRSFAIRPVVRRIRMKRRPGVGEGNDTGQGFQYGALERAAGATAGRWVPFGPCALVVRLVRASDPIKHE